MFLSPTDSLLNSTASLFSCDTLLLSWTIQIYFSPNTSSPGVHPDITRLTTDQATHNLKRVNTMREATYKAPRSMLSALQFNHSMPSPGLSSILFWSLTAGVLVSYISVHPHPVTAAGPYSCQLTSAQPHHFSAFILRTSHDHSPHPIIPLKAKANRCETFTLPRSYSASSTTSSTNFTGHHCLGSRARGSGPFPVYPANGPYSGDTPI